MEAATKSQDIEKFTWAVYALQVLARFILFPDFIGIVINLVMRKDANTDPLFRAHFRWQIETFLWSWGFVLIGLVLCLTVIGIFVAIPLWIFAYFWTWYRVIRGALSFSNQQLPKPGYN